MLVISGPIRLNETDTLFFGSNLTVLANASYSNGSWSISASAIASGNIGDTPTQATKAYDFPATQLGEMDKGDGKFAAQLGMLVESLVAEDLRVLNPGVEIKVEL